MNDSYETIELNKFCESMMQDLISIQLSDEEGGMLEQIFTQYAIDLLIEAGETENARVVYDEQALGTRNQHKINAYSISDNYETIDLFITIFKSRNLPERISKDEIDTATKRIVNFFNKGIYRDYVNEIEESSPIFDFAHTLGKSPDLKENLVRVNVIMLTNGYYPGEFPKDQNIAGYPVFFRIIDINYLFNISEKTHIPIEIDFESDGFEVPCIISPSVNELYQSYLAVIPGTALATIYERYGSRLLEQNVRSFLQFTGKINKGIRSTILKEPHMFLAFNNGLSATAEEIEFKELSAGNGFSISKVKDFQIVNGGQTTASVYHTYKKDKADISKIFVQMKISVVNNRENFSEIVSQISEYANTQNKVSISDLSSNKPFHIQLEKISRTYYTPHISGRTTQSRWFYERARGQYKNARLKEGFTSAKRKIFDLKNPRNQVFNKEDLAKFDNAFQEIYEGKKLVKGPHFVVRGNQKNYIQFINNNLPKTVDNIYYEDLIAKAIIFKTAEKVYGIKPNAIGDMRYITVPYSISYLNYKLTYNLDLYKIWKNQELSEVLTSVLYQVMLSVESFIKSKAPGALYGEWAKKEECWNELKKHETGIAFESLLKDDLESTNNFFTRRIVDLNIDDVQIDEDLNKIRSIPSQIWKDVEKWGQLTGHLTQYERDYAFTLAGRVRNNGQINEYERRAGINIIDKVVLHAPEILEKIDELDTVNPPVQKNDTEVTNELLKKMIKWDRIHSRLKDFEHKFLIKLADGRNPMSEKNKSIALAVLEKIRKNGFDE